MRRQLLSNVKNYEHCASCTLLACLCKQREGTRSLPRTFRRGEGLFRLGDQFDALYVMQVGSAKSFSNTVSGYEQITNFHFPGDLMGLEGFDKMVHVHSVRFLEHSSVCRISINDFNRALIDSDTGRHFLLSRMSHLIVDEQQLLLSLTKHDAKQRLVKFLLDLSKKHNQSTSPSQVFRLSMTRIDIANYLGMAIETISRLLSKMHAQGVIKVNKRQITLCDVDDLRAYLLASE